MTTVTHKLLETGNEYKNFRPLQINTLWVTVLGLHSRDAETAMLVYKTIENGPTSFA